MTQVVKLIERNFMMEFITLNSTVSDWLDDVRVSMRDNGFLFQHRIFAPISQAKRVKEEFEHGLDRSRRSEPLLFVCEDNLPLQFVGIVVIPTDENSVVKPLPGGFMLTTDDIKILFSKPIVSGPKADKDSFSIVFQKISTTLSSADMDITDLVRTWLYLPNLITHYELLNNARDVFFNDQYPINNSFFPASTAINGSFISAPPLTMDFCAFSGNHVCSQQVKSPLQNEPVEYDKLFSRAVAVVLNKNQLIFVSGTASINKSGESIYRCDFDKQMGHILKTIQAILAERHCDFSSVAQCMVFIKQKKDLSACRRALKASGFPWQRTIILVDTDLCRDELLCEIELCALSARIGGTPLINTI